MMRNPLCLTQARVWRAYALWGWFWPLALRRKACSSWPGKRCKPHGRLTDKHAAVQKSKVSADHNGRTDFCFLLPYKETCLIFAALSRCTVRW